MIVISCLQDLYDAVRGKLSRTLLDRLERNEVRLISTRQPDEIEQMLIRRLEYLYSFFDVAWREDDPLYPFTPAQIQSVSQLRTRDCLDAFRKYHSVWITARSIVTVEPAGGIDDSVEPEPPLPSSDLEKMWAETLAASRPPEDSQILALVAEAIRGAAAERGLDLNVRAVALAVLPHLILEGRALARRIVAVCNMRVIATKASGIAVALRSGDFKFQPKSKMAEYVGAHIAASGIAVPLPEAHLRTAAAVQTSRYRLRMGVPALVKPAELAHFVRPNARDRRRARCGSPGKADRPRGRAVPRARRHPGDRRRAHHSPPTTAAFRRWMSDRLTRFLLESTHAVSTERPGIPAASAAI